MFVNRKFSDNLKYVKYKATLYYDTYQCWYDIAIINRFSLFVKRVLSGAVEWKALSLACVQLEPLQPFIILNTYLGNYLLYATLNIFTYLYVSMVNLAWTLSVLEFICIFWV